MFVFWLILAVLLIILEVSLGFTIVLFFSGLAAFSVSILLYMNVISSQEVISQFAVFFVATAFWGVILWKPLKKIVKDISRNPDQYKNIIGEDCIVEDVKITRDRPGTVKWSGTLVRASIDQSNKRDEVFKDDVLVITNIVDNIFIIKDKK